MNIGLHLICLCFLSCYFSQVDAASIQSGVDISFSHQYFQNHLKSDKYRELRIGVFIGKDVAKSFVAKSVDIGICNDNVYKKTNSDFALLYNPSLHNVQDKVLFNANEQILTLFAPVNHTILLALNLEKYVLCLRIDVSDEERKCKVEFMKSAGKQQTNSINASVYKHSNESSDSGQCDTPDSQCGVNKYLNTYLLDVEKRGKNHVDKKELQGSVLHEYIDFDELVTSI